VDVIHTYGIINKAETELYQAVSDAVVQLYESGELTEISSVCSATTWSSCRSSKREKRFGKAVHAGFPEADTGGFAMVKEQFDLGFILEIFPKLLRAFPATLEMACCRRCSAGSLACSSPSAG
jgi:hypothetical protein